MGPVTRVLHVIGAPVGDAAVHQVRLLVSRLPYDSEVATLIPPDAATDAIRDTGTPVRTPLDPGDHDLTAIRKLRRLIRSGRFDLVHTHLFRACVPGRIAARTAGTPYVVATEHMLPAEAARRHTSARALYLTGERHGRVTVAASGAVADRLRELGVPAGRITVIPRAIDPAEFRFDPALRAAARARLRIAPGTPVIGGVGRLEPRKRFDRLIRAVGGVPDATLLLVGDGSARVALERLAAIEGVADRVLFAGAVGHAREMLCAMDVFASPATETFGLTVLEAMAAGLPALYTRCAPLESGGSTVDHTRRLTAHDPESLPRALRAEVLVHGERGGARLPGRSLGGCHDADAMAEAVGRLYERVADQRR